MTKRPKGLTFSQAHGCEPLPAPLRLGELSREVRNLLWAMLWESLREDYSSYDRQVTGHWREVVRLKHVVFEKEPADEVRYVIQAVVEDLKRYCYEARFDVLFSLLEFICQQHPSGRELAKSLNTALTVGRAAYRINVDDLEVEPAATEEEGRAIHEAFKALEQEQFAGARVHLRNAGKYLGQGGKEAESVRESITAVEGVCRVLAKAPKATLDDALKVLAAKVDLHPAFRKGLSQLYGYTSDEKGIRHSLIEQGTANVDLADAQFMFGACAAFVSYLIGKARSAGLI